MKYFLLLIVQNVVFISMSILKGFLISQKSLLQWCRDHSWKNQLLGGMLDLGHTALCSKHIWHTVGIP
jgi:hypothetical protein